MLIRNYIWRSFENIIFIVLLFFPLLTLSHFSPFFPSFAAHSQLSIIYLFIFQHFHFGVLLLLFCYFTFQIVRCSFSFGFLESFLLFLFLFLYISCYFIHHNKGYLKGKHVVILLGLRDKNRS